MTQEWNDSTGGFPVPGASTDFCDYLASLNSGVETVATHFAGATDPDDSWGADEVGYPWLDFGIDGTTVQPLAKRWERLTTGGTYGWRLLCLRYWAWVDDPGTDTPITFGGSLPYTADRASSDISLAALLNTVQVHNDKPVDAVLMRVRVKDAFSSGSRGQDAGYVEFTHKGSTSWRQRVYVNNSDEWVEQLIIVPLNSAEEFSYSVVVATGTSPSFQLQGWIIGWLEKV